MDLQKLKRLNLRQPKYIFPLVIFLPLLGLIYTSDNPSTFSLWSSSCPCWGSSTSVWRPSRATARPPRT